MLHFIDHLPLNLALALRTAPSFPDKVVKLDDIEKSLNIYLHALSRSCAQKVVAAEHKRNLRALSSRRHVNALVWQESDNAHLPETIQRFDDARLNRDLYYWLAAYIAFDQPLPAPDPRQALLSEALGHVLQGVMTSARVLKACPGLIDRYQRLCGACLAERDQLIPSLNQHHHIGAAMLESGIRHALGDTNTNVPRWLLHAIDAANVGILLPDPPAALLKPGLPLWPVALWGRPTQSTPAEISLVEELLDEEFLEDKRDEPEEPEQLDEAAYLELSDDEDEGDELTGTYLYPEWNCKTNAYRENWCQVIEDLQESEGWEEPPAELKRLSRRVRRAFEALRTDDRWLRRQSDGEDVNIDDFINAVSERRGCGYASENLYQHRKRDNRELAVMVLLDVSNSTQFQMGNSRVIDVERQAMLVLAEALSELGDVFGIYAFSGYGRNQVDCLRLKDFDDDYNNSVRERIFCLTPRGSTRIGAALRHMGKRIMRRTERHRLLLLLTDGRPFDPADNYTGLYALEDTRKALQELHNDGIYTYGLTIDRAGLEYLPYLFGPGKYTVFSNVLSLPEFLPKLYARLTSLGK